MRIGQTTDIQEFYNAMIEIDLRSIDVLIKGLEEQMSDNIFHCNVFGHTIRSVRDHYLQSATLCIFEAKQAELFQDMEMKDQFLEIAKSYQGLVQELIEGKK
jgi:hypothetical protein